MTFDPTIPGPEDIYSNSQPQILENFSQVETIQSVDHVGFSASSAVRGLHNQVRCVTLGNVADPATTENEILYTILRSASNTTALRFRSKNNGAASLFADGGKVYWSNGPVAGAIFDLTGATFGTAVNIASITPVVVTASRRTFDIVFSSAVTTNCQWQLSPIGAAGYDVGFTLMLTALSTTGCTVEYRIGINSLLPSKISLIINTPYA